MRQPLGQVLLRVNAANLRSASIVGAGSLQIDRLKGTKVEIGLRGPGRRLASSNVVVNSVGRIQRHAV